MNKRLITIALSLFLCFSASAQWYFGGGITGGFNNSSGAIGIVPEIGYRITPHLSAGVNFGYIFQTGSSYNMHRFILDPYLRAQTSVAGFLYLFAEAFVRYDGALTGYDDGSRSRGDMVRAGVRPGLAVPLGGNSFMIARLGYLGIKSGSSDEKDGQFTYHCSSSDISVGFAYSF